MTDIVSQVKDKVDILDIAEKYLTLKRSGNEYVGLCPFHNERDGSFYINPEKGVFYCFGCKETGDVISLYAQLNGLDFKESLDELAISVGIDTNSQPNNNSNRKDYLDAYKYSSEFYIGKLSENSNAKQYLLKRGITQASIDKFEIGYAPNAWDSLKQFLSRHSFRSNLYEFKLLGRSDYNQREYDLFRDRIIFPIHDMHGRVVAFGGRSINENNKPKYYNTPESDYFKKKTVLYGLHQAKNAIKKQGLAIITEGYLDVILMSQHGFENTVSVLGTSLSQEHAKKLLSITDTFLLVFDGDIAGQKAAFKNAEVLLKEGANVNVVELPQKEDPDSYIRKIGFDKFNAYIDKNKVEGLQYCIDKFKQHSPKILSKWSKSFLSSINDPILKSHYTNKISQILNVNSSQLLSLIRNDVTSSKKEKVTDKISYKDEEILTILILRPSFISRFNELNGLAAIKNTKCYDFARKIIGNYQNGESLMSCLNAFELSLYNKIIYKQSEENFELERDVEKRLITLSVYTRNKEKINLMAASSNNYRKGNSIKYKFNINYN